MRERCGTCRTGAEHAAACPSVGHSGHWSLSLLSAVSAFVDCSLCQSGRRTLVIPWIDVQRGRSFTPALSSFTTSAMRRARSSGRLLVPAIQVRYALR